MHIATTQTRQPELMAQDLMQEADEQPDVLVFAPDEDVADDPRAHEDEERKWLILIVDDDEDVHIVTAAVLNDIRFDNRGLQITSCRSGSAACDFLDANPDISVILLDVVMETDDAGLGVVRHVRETLENRKVRIILRTGQPGQAPEKDVIVGYDINDYKSKTELTAQKLFTTIITALRSYSDIVALETNRNGLQFISDTSTTLLSIPDPRAFAAHALDALLRFIGGEQGALFASDPSDSSDGTILRTLALHGWSGDPGSAFLKRIDAIAERKASRHEDKNTYLYFVTPQKRELIVHLSHRRPTDPLTIDLLDHFTTRIGVAFDNIAMQNLLSESNASLETQVKARTEELSERTERLEAAQRQMAEELKLAHVLQQAILPTKMPCEDVLEAAAKMIPAHQVGGDFYQLTQLDENRIAIIIADVSGKGVVAAFFMLRAHNLLQEIIRRNSSPAEVLALANAQLCEANPLTLFVTVFFGVLNLKTSTFTYSSGGHNMPLLLKRDGDAHTLPRARGMLLGCFEEAEFSERHLVIEPGDRLFLFTDGFTEALNAQGGWFGDEQLRASLVRHGALPVDASMHAIINDVNNFAGETPQSDDIACVLIGLRKEALLGTAA